MSPSPSTVRGSPKADRATSTDDVSDDGSSNPAVKTILNSRKCWRNMKGKEEAVWPPDLEAALIGGLEKYRPAEAKSNRVLGRFPMRNKFVADHIFETTGQRRTPKQVGSRIQQLRDTSSGKHILKAISDKHYEMMHPKKSATDEQEAGPSRRKTQLLQPSKTATLSAPTPMLAHVYINTLPPHYSWLPSAGSPIPLSSIYSQEAKPLRTIDPTVSFTSAEQTPCQAFFQLYKAGQFVQQEYAPVSISCGPLSETGAPLFTYSTTLVPQHWSYLCEVEDLPAYTIYLEVVRLPLSSAPHSPTIALSSVLYHFVDATTYTFAASTPPLSPRSSCGEGEFDFPPLSSGSTSTFGQHHAHHTAARWC
ncbi:hypothetical protein BDW22DRAFT_684334 [Trametopsis cervina]|nr:hypothetical protein BDW22DRAFT_684334 [Trametopsis cervina]